MNIFRIFLESSLMAQVIMALLSFFSIWSWAIFLKKLFNFGKINKLSKHFLTNYRFHQKVREWENFGTLLTDNPYGRVLRSGTDEYRRLRQTMGRPVQGQTQQVPSVSVKELSDNMRLVMEKTKLAETKQLEASLPVLSTIVSVSPFLGLLGTVWGVMIAFLDIRTRGSAHITVVAPGISDALITTVYGLIVAIPALIFFNIFRTRVNNFEAGLSQFVHEVFATLRKEFLLKHEH